MMKPLRTALFAPGNRPDMAEKALGFGADAIIIDLEDAVPLAEKEVTRGKVRQVLDKHPGKRMYVRINALSTPFAKQDLQAVVSKNLNVVMIPKFESPDDIFEIDRCLTELEKINGLETGALDVISICETAKGLEGIYPIVSARPEHHSVSVVAFGAADFTADLGISLTVEGKELEYARSRIPIASRAAGIMPPLDSPWMIDLNDIDGLIADAKRAKAYCFQGKIVIHPNQIDPCHAVFTPNIDEVLYARKVIKAFEKAERNGNAAIQLEGRFIDYAFLQNARRICALAEAGEDRDSLVK